MAVQVTTCRERGHIVAAPLQAAQLVSGTIPQWLKNSVKNLDPVRQPHHHGTEI